MSNPSDLEAREFYVQTGFQRAARRPGGIPRNQALRNAEANIERIKPSFATWLDNEFDELLRAVPDAKAAGPKDPSWIEPVDRCSNRLIDVAATMGYPFVSFVATNLRAICEAIRAGAQCHDEVIACHIDALFLGKRPNYLNMAPSDLPELSEGLRRIVESTNVRPKSAGLSPCCDDALESAPQSEAGASAPTR